MSTLKQKQERAIDYLHTSTAGLPIHERITLFRSFAALMSDAHVAGVLFAWADEFEGAEKRNDQLRLDFKNPRASSNDGV